MAEFDTVSKQLIQTYPHDFIRFALQRDDIERVKVLDTEQPTIRRTDSLLHVSLADDEKVLVHHEFQTTDSTDPPMPQRMAAYIGYYIGQYGLPIHSTSSICVPTLAGTIRGIMPKSGPATASWCNTR